MAQSFGFVNHRQRNAVFDRTARVLVFQLQKQAAGARLQLMQLEERSLADKFTNRMQY